MPFPIMWWDYTRGRDKLHLIHPKTDFGKKSLQFKGVQLYNSLPGSVHVLKNLTIPSGTHVLCIFCFHNYFLLYLI